MKSVRFSHRKSLKKLRHHFYYRQIIFRREMCRAFGLRKYSRVPGGGMSRRSSRYDFSMAAPSTAQPGNFTSGSGLATTTFNSSGNNARFLPTSGSNGNFRVNYSSNNGTNSVKCVAIVNNDNDNNSISSCSNVVNANVINANVVNANVVRVLPKDICLDSNVVATTVSHTTTPPPTPTTTTTKDIVTNNGRLVKDSSQEDNSDQIVPTCLIENFAEKKNAIFV
jgi:hypothetical protein